MGATGLSKDVREYNVGIDDYKTSPEDLVIKTEEKI